MLWSSHAHISFFQCSHNLCDFVICEVVFKAEKNQNEPKSKPQKIHQWDLFN